MGDIPKPIASVQDTQSTGTTGDGSVSNWLLDIRGGKRKADPDALKAAAQPDTTVAPPSLTGPGIPTMRDVALQDKLDLAYSSNQTAENGAKIIPLVAVAGAGILSSKQFLPPPVKQFLESKSSFGNRFGSLALGEASGAVVDHFTEDNLSHRFTNVSDLVVDPLIATRMRGNFAVKGAVMLGSHVLGRVIDYFCHVDPAGDLAQAKQHRPETPLDVMDRLTGTKAPALSVETPVASPPPQRKIEYNPLAGSVTTPEDRHMQQINRARQLGVRPEDLPYADGGVTESYKGAPVKGAKDDPTVAPPAVKTKPTGSLFY